MAQLPGTFTPGQGYTQADPSEPPLIYVAPTSVAGRLREGLFGSRTVVLTSATLTVGTASTRSPTSWGSQALARPDGTASMWEPFDYPSQGMLYVAKHLPPRL